MGRFVDVFDTLCWPVLTTLASVVPRRLGRLIRTDDSEWVEADPIG